MPKLTMQIIENREEKKLTGTIFQVTISPAPAPQHANPDQPKAPQTPEAQMLSKLAEIRRSLKDPAS